MGKPGTAPVIRVRHMQETLAALDRLEGARGEAVLDSLGDPVALSRDSASRIADAGGGRRRNVADVEGTVEVSKGDGALTLAVRWSTR